MKRLPYSDVTDKSEPIFFHRLLPLQLQVDSGLRLWPVLRSARRLLERLGQRKSTRIFRGHVAHLTHCGGLGVSEGAELAGPLLEEERKACKANTNKN